MMNLTNEQVREEVKHTLDFLLPLSVSIDTVGEISNLIFEDVVRDVIEDSDIQDGAPVRDSIVRIAIGRVLLKKLRLSANTYCESCENSLDRGTYLRCVRNGFNAGFEVDPKHFCKHGIPKKEGKR